jgi:hypothetical protein
MEKEKERDMEEKRERVSESESECVFGKVVKSLSESVPDKTLTK